MNGTGITKMKWHYNCIWHTGWRDVSRRCSHSWGISDEHSINTVARCLNANLSSEESMQWPPTVEEFESLEEPHPLLRQIFIWLRNPAERDFIKSYENAVVTALSSLIFSYITHKMFPFKTHLSLTVHELPRRRDSCRSSPLVSATRMFSICMHHGQNMTLKTMQYAPRN